MKKIIFVLVFIMGTAICVDGHNYYDKRAAISVQSFYDELLPYGEWINTPDYGYVWRPYIDNQDNFRPYSSRGNWVYTDIGWTWISEYRWGWATFHYGRWYFDDYLGWMWIPGNEWAPAWVTWGSYNDLWAWAPMGPNIQINFNTNRYAPNFWWTFVPRQHFCSENWYRYRYNQPVRITNITYITNVYYENNYQHHNRNWFNGPSVRDVERHLNKRVQRMQLVDNDKPDNLVARNNRVNVYRPGVKSERENLRPAKYRTVSSIRSEQTHQRPTDVNPKHTGRSGVEKPTRTSHGSPKANVERQQAKKSDYSSYQRNAQIPTIDRNTRKNNSRNNLTGNRSSSKSSGESKRAQSSSPQKIKSGVFPSFL
ncbi:MAG: hypothetical protein NTW16_16080 [Bacteroidetes bacterium]|nr:hypothetical protein [Bacteroidota bacterium]